MRSSCDKDDHPGYVNFLMGYTVVFLNGEKVSHCFVADEEQGYIECYKLDLNGKFYIDPEHPDELVAERIEGKVEIFKDKNPL